MLTHKKMCHMTSCDEFAVRIYQKEEFPSLREEGLRPWYVEKHVLVRSQKLSYDVQVIISG